MMRFYDFYPSRSRDLYNISTQTCAATLASYEAHPNPDNCTLQSSCILSNPTPAAVASAGSLSVHLGLTPTILVLMGSSLAEVNPQRVTMAGYR